MRVLNVEDSARDSALIERELQRRFKSQVPPRGTVARIAHLQVNLQRGLIGEQFEVESPFKEQLAQARPGADLQCRRERPQQEGDHGLLPAGERQAQIGTGRQEPVANRAKVGKSALSD